MLHDPAFWCGAVAGASVVVVLIVAAILIAMDRKLRDL